MSSNTLCCCDVGNCCVRDTCVQNVTQQECLQQGGQFIGNTPCVPNPCVIPPIFGTCCVGQNCFENVTEVNCIGAGGLWLGPGISCTPNPCIASNCWQVFRLCLDTLCDPPVPLINTLYIPCSLWMAQGQPQIIKWLFPNPANCYTLDGEVNVLPDPMPPNEHELLTWKDVITPPGLTCENCCPIPACPLNPCAHCADLYTLIIPPKVYFYPNTPATVELDGAQGLIGRTVTQPCTWSAGLGHPQAPTIQGTGRYTIPGQGTAPLTSVQYVFFVRCLANPQATYPTSTCGTTAAWIGELGVTVNGGQLGSAQCHYRGPVAAPISCPIGAYARCSCTLGFCYCQDTLTIV